MAELETVSNVQKRPGVVIFVSILQFFSASLFLSLSLLSALAIVFGAAWGVDKYVTQQMTHYAPNPNFTYGLTVFFSVLSGTFFLLALFFMFLGIGLFRGKKYAWYVQVFMSVLAT